MEEKLRLETLRLCKLWLDLLDHAGEYAKRYYLSRILENGFGIPLAKARQTLERTYKTVGNLDKAIRHDLDAFPTELLEICDAQAACGLREFRREKWYLDRIMMGLTMKEQHGSQRRSSYKDQINKILKDATKGPVAVLSLNQLEAGFQEKMRKAAA